MKSHLILSALVIMGLALISGPVRADMPGVHPGYLHALSDLRLARWLVARRSGDPLVNAHDGAAYEQITWAIHDLKIAAIDDGKNIDDHPPVDIPPDRRGRLETALKALYKAHEDMESEEQNHPIANLRQAATGHINDAIRSIVAAISDIENHRY